MFKPNFVVIRDGNPDTFSDSKTTTSSVVLGPILGFQWQTLCPQKYPLLLGFFVNLDSQKNLIDTVSYLSVR